MVESDREYQTTDVRVSFRECKEEYEAVSSVLPPPKSAEEEEESPTTSERNNNKTVKVSFRDDVVFSASTRSSRSHASAGDSSCLSEGSSQKHMYSKLRSNLTREQTNRDPFYFYRVTKNLGSGSMGDVKLVKKRDDKIGGSARRDIQQAVKRQLWEKECLQLPVIGNLFQFCIDGDLKDTGSFSDYAEASRHSVISWISQRSDKDDSSGDNNSRSFEDSLLAATNNLKSEKNEIIYALKSVHLDRVERKEFIDELRNEIAILKDLDHPNIVRAIETFEWKGKISIVMELCSGGDLYTRDPYTEPEAARIMSYILSAIAYMHSRKVVHRDLKFENVLFVNQSPMSEVKLIDFGLSKVYADKALTEISGTIYTMAPEVLMGMHTEKADMWSCGVLAVMLLSSSLPFHGMERKDVMNKILANKYSFKGRRWKQVSAQAKAFVKTLLVTDPDDRADAETALNSEWLNTYLRSGPTSTRRVPTTEEEEMARTSMEKYAGYPKLKKMALMVVAHRSSSEEIGILRSLFKQYDSRHDGSIWFDEFGLAMSECGYSNEELRIIFDAMDLSGSGRIRYTEFIAASIEAHGAIGEARLAEAFDRLDCDDSGYITADNLTELLGEGISRDEINAIVEEVDISKNNRVSYSEFLALWQDTQELDKNDNLRVLGSELSSISVESEGSKNTEDERAAFLKAKHLQNTLHNWAMEMQLPAHVFALGCSFLHQVALGNQDDVEYILEERPGLVNFRDYDRRTALHIAASEGHVAICHYLVEKGARVNRGDRWGGFPLDDAHRHGHSDVINLLQQHGAKFGSTSQIVNLITAASEGNVEEVRKLLEFGSLDLNQGDYDHRTALHLAANDGHLEVVKLLCKAGADVNVKDRWGDRPLDDAKKAKKNSTAIIKILSGGAVAVSSTDQEAARMHDLNNPSGKPPTISQSRESENEGMTQLPAQDFAMGCSILHQAALGNKPVLKNILLERPMLANFRDYDRRTALHIAASEGQLDICRFLVDKGAKINRVDRWGGSPLDDAHRHKHADVVMYLREQGAKFGSTNQLTNFITAASEGDMEEVQAFLDFGSIDLNQGDYDHRTALHLAAGEGRYEVVRMLCEAGADVNVQDRWGGRPLDDAKSAKENSVGVVKLLLRHGAKSTRMVTRMAIAHLTLFGTVGEL